MRIGVDISCVPYGRGPARYTTEIVKALSGFAESNDTFFLYSPSGTAISGLAAPAVVTALPLQRCRPWLNWTLARAARKDRIDVMFFPANDCWLWKATPTIVALLDVAPGTSLLGYLPSWKDRLQVRLQMKRAGRVAEKIITISHYSAKEINEAVPGSRDKIHVVYCGVSGVFRSTETVGKIALDEPYILFVGGFDRRKNIERLLRAYCVLRGRGKSEKLFMIGKSGRNPRLYYDMPGLLRQYGLEKKVIILHDVDDAALADYYRCASLLVLPSIIEGFGLPIIEAHACGCPVACSTAASLPEAGGAAASYFDPYDVVAMADSMEKILIDESYRARLREQGRENVKHFSWERAGAEVYSLLQQVSKRPTDDNLSRWFVIPEGSPPQAINGL